MLILDTDHLTAPQRGDAALRKRLAQSDERVATTIVSIGEHMKGMAALVGSARSPGSVAASYARMLAWCSDVASIPIIPRDDAASNAFRETRAMRIRVGTMDLRIVALVATRNARLLTRNARDFDRIPSLRHEDWIVD